MSGSIGQMFAQPSNTTLKTAFIRGAAEELGRALLYYLFIFMIKSLETFE